MISLPDRQHIVALIDEAVENGARRMPAAHLLGLNVRTVERWRTEGADVVRADQRPTAIRPPSSRCLSEAERAEVLAIAHSPAFASLPPSQIVPKLADQGRYVASESTFYRLLKAADLQHHRGRARAPVRRHRPTSYRATGPNQVWCWDITWLPSAVKGLYYYWYMVLDVYSRKIVAHEVHTTESAEHAGHLLTRASLSEGLSGRPLVLHSDNGSSMKGSTMLAALQGLGIIPSFSRPRVSDDNPYAEALFRTAKYCPDYPTKPFADLHEAQAWVLRFVRWYNEDHQHSGIQFVTPAQRHTGDALRIIERRKHVYEEARSQHPERWSQTLRNWDLPTEVWLNPERVSPESKQEAA